MNDGTANSNRQFDNLVTMLIATTAIWVAITAYFQNYAANLSDQARRRAQQYAIEATRLEVNGNIQLSYEWQGAFQTWREIGWQIVAAEQNGDAEAVERYEQLQDRIEPHSLLLGRDYFDPNLGWPNTYKFEAERYLVEATRLSETYRAESELGNATDETADGLIVQITLLTVSLSLFGLSLALQGRVRWLFVVVGSGIVGLCMLWLGWSMIELLVRPEVNQKAIQAYAEGAGVAYQGKYNEAIEKFTLAIEEDPYYGKAYYQRGLAYYDLGDYETAITEMETARQNGLDDVSLNWNLGWIYYLSGNYDKAIETNERILSTKPEILGMRMNEAISYLCKGDIAGAQHQYDLLIQEAERQVREAREDGVEPPALLWYYMDAGALDLQNLIDQLDNNPKPWTQAPDPNLISGDHAKIREFAYGQMVRLKEAIVALEYAGRLPDAQEVMRVTSFRIGQITETDDQGFVVSFEPARDGIIPYGVQSFSIEYTYTGPAPKHMVWKIYFNGYEDQSLRSVSTEDISGGTTWYRTFGYDYTNVFILSSGEFTVELYADHRLVLRGTFTVK